MFCQKSGQDDDVCCIELVSFAREPTTVWVGRPTEVGPADLSLVLVEWPLREQTFPRRAQ